MSEKENNSIHLKLPNVSFERCRDEGLLANEMAGEGPFLPLEMGEDDAKSDREDEPLGHTHFPNRRETQINDLHDLYFFLQQLSPTYSDPSENSFHRGYGYSGGVRRQEHKPKSRTEAEKTRKKAEKGTEDSFESTIGIEECEEAAGGKRETLKMASINLYQSILPSTLFTGSGRRARH